MAAIAIGLGTLGSVLLNSLQSRTRWGIYNVNGKLLAGVSKLTLLKSLSPQHSEQSVLGVDYQKQYRISEFQIEAGSFASYNKVAMSASPVVSLTLAGNQQARTNFLNAIDAAAASTDLYNIVTPEVVYTDYSIKSYTYSRKAGRGATLIVVDIELQEIREVSAAYTQSANTITNTQTPSAVSTANSGNVQPTPPETSVLNSIVQKLGAALGRVK